MMVAAFERLGGSKPITDLTLKDIEVHPIWAWALDEEADEGKDETWVFPIKGNVIPNADETFISSAVATLANGLAVPALIELSYPSDIESTIYSPVCIFWHEQQIPFDGVPYSVAQMVGLTQLPEAKLFPVQWRLSALVSGEQQPRSGVELIRDPEADKAALAAFIKSLDAEGNAT